MVDFLVIGPYLSVGNANMFSLIKNRNICLGYIYKAIFYFIFYYILILDCFTAVQVFFVIFLM